MVILGRTVMIDELVDFVEALGGVEVSPDFLTQVQKKLRLAPEHTDDPTVKFRASKIGRPWVLQMIERWYGGGPRPIMFTNAMAMMNGNITQEVIAHLFATTKYKVEQEVELSHLSVKGHADMVLTQPGSIVVLECKSMAPHMFKQFEHNPSDEYGYLSQLAFYAGCLKRQNPGVEVEPGFIIFDRGSSKFKLIPIQWFALEHKIQRYIKMLPILEEVQPYDIEHLLDVVDIPPVTLGKLPTSMKYTKWASYLYDVDASNNYSVKSRDRVIARFEQLTAKRSDGVELL
jgi:hypothetical protein